MSRITRSQQAAVSLVSQDAKKIVKTISKKVTRSKENVKKALDQNDNAVQKTKGSKEKYVKSVQVKIHRTKLLSTQKENTLIQKNALSTIKSPALHDRTNTPVKKSIQLSTSEVSNKIKKTLKICSTNKLQNQKKTLARKNTKKIEEAQVVEKQMQKKESQHSSPFKNQFTKKKNISIEDVEKLLNDDDDSDSSEMENQANEKEAAKEKPITKISTRSSQNKKIDVEKLLNNGDDNVDSEMENQANEKEVAKEKPITKISTKSSQNKKDNKNNELSTEKAKIIEKKNEKKFFKHKSVIKDIKAKLTKDTAKNNNRKKVTTRKRVKIDSPYSPHLETKSTEPPPKRLRKKETKNYCEISKVNENSNSSTNKPINKENSGQPDNDPSNANKKSKGLPIYKTIRLSQEKDDNKEEVYDFLYDSQESGQKTKKRKRTIKRTAVKRPRKVAILQPAVIQPLKKKTVKKVIHNLQFKNLIEETCNSEEPKSVSTVQIAMVPEKLPSMGPDTFEEASTIKILSDQKLDGSSKINLMATPNVPKTITSELKLFGPKNAITSEPTTKYSNMVNHSLIRKSMSPITKIVDNFDAGSPWRSADTFSRVKKMVQSTPHINRLPSIRDKRLAAQIMNLNKISMSQEETIHISSIAENSSNKGENLEVEPAAKENVVSPRTFGTEISNLSPVKSSTNSSASSQNNSTKNLQPSLTSSSKANQKSPLSVVSPQKSISELLTDPPSMTHVTNYNESKISTSKKSPQKKFSTPSPFRFDKMRTSKRIASLNESQSKVNKSIVQTKVIEPEAGPSWLDKPQPTLRQSNLHNFLNMDELPESTRISTAHGIFDDLHSTPVHGKKLKSTTDDLNVENAFGFDDDSSEQMDSVKPTSILATEEDVKKSVKGKVFLKARVKSAVPSRISANTVKQTLLKNTLKKKAETNVDIFKIFDQHEIDEFDSISENKENIEPKKSVKSKKAISDTSSIKSFSDTFDLLSENEEASESQVPDNIPLFTDLEPVHFTQPPRRSYLKRKRGQVLFDVSKDSSDDEDEQEKPKPKKKKESKQSKQEQKRLEQWVKSMNETFDEIEHFDLLVE